MNESEALRDVRRVARTGLIFLSPHAQRRMQDRNLQLADVEELTLAVILRGGILVVTVY